MSTTYYPGDVVKFVKAKGDATTYDVDQHHYERLAAIGVIPVKSRRSGQERRVAADRLVLVSRGERGKAADDEAQARPRTGGTVVDFVTLDRAAQMVWGTLVTMCERAGAARVDLMRDESGEEWIEAEIAGHRVEIEPIDADTTRDVNLWDVRFYGLAEHGESAAVIGHGTAEQIGLAFAAALHRLAEHPIALGYARRRNVAVPLVPIGSRIRLGGHEWRRVGVSRLVPIGGGQGMWISQMLGHGSAFVVNEAPLVAAGAHAERNEAEIRAQIDAKREAHLLVLTNHYADELHALAAWPGEDGPMFEDVEVTYSVWPCTAIRARFAGGTTEIVATNAEDATELLVPGAEPEEVDDAWFLGVYAYDDEGGSDLVASGKSTNFVKAVAEAITRYRTGDTTHAE